MRIGRVIICALLVLSQLQLSIPTANALGSQNVVIKQIYPGATGIAAQEFVELYNNALSPVDVTGWCLYYKSSNGGFDPTGWTKFGCLTPPDTSTKLWIKAGGYVTFASSDYKTATLAISDVTFTGGMNAAAGHLRLADAANVEVDRVGWGTANNPETAVAVAPANTKSLQRKAVTAGFQDSDNNSVDFEQTTPLFHSSDLYEIVTYVDVCPNINDTQTVMPTGYLADENGNCQPDSCLNIPGLQISVPDNYDSNAGGSCAEHDECDNLPGIQTEIPEYMVRADTNDCAWDLPQLVLSEIMPNAIGTDTGNEFVEIYNPTNQTIDLSFYSVKTGVGSDKSYAFPIGSTIGPGEYRSFSDSVMKFTLVNTTGRVVLTAMNNPIGDSGVYDSPGDGESWALIDGVWQYTNQPTPGAPNQASIIEEPEVDSTDMAPAPCPAGKYRNPLTNRCRTIEADASVLATCDADQYRNPETGRCKKISATTLAACKDNQYRSEETNRCRNIIAASVGKPCKDGQYRSEETNRCRNLPASSVPSAAFAVQPVKDTGMAFVGWWALGGVGLVAVGYGAWEWRREILAQWNRLFKR